LAGGEGKKRTRRSYRPAVEAMEALRLLSSAVAAASFPGLAVEHNVLADHGAAKPLVNALPSVPGETWDAALLQTHLTDLLSGVGSAFVSSSASTSTSDASALSSGLAQLNKYLSRAWYRAGIPVQMHEDCSQAVYTTMLQQLGRDQFDALISDVGHSGIKDVFSRETNEGLDFFRAVDMIKKRALRERVYHSLDAVDVPASSGSAETKAWSDALREAIDHSLSPREASLINETLMGKTPAEIAHHWGVAPKTVSNEKARVLQKLREVLLAQNPN
jgi:DNA-binding CsgD family transcriptional regulator